MDRVGAPDDPGQPGRQAARVRLPGGRRLRGPGGFRLRFDRRGEAVSAAWDVHDETVTGRAIAEHLAERSDMDPEVGLLDGDIGPDGGDHVVVTDDLTGAPDQNDEDVERAAAERDGLALHEQEPPRRRKLERPESERPLGHLYTPHNIHLLVFTRICVKPPRARIRAWRPPGPRARIRID